MDAFRFSPELFECRNDVMAALTDAASDVGTSGVGNCRQIARVRFSDSQVSRQ